MPSSTQPPGRPAALHHVPRLLQHPAQARRQSRAAGSRTVMPLAVTRILHTRAGQRGIVHMRVSGAGQRQRLSSNRASCQSLRNHDRYPSLSGCQSMLSVPVDAAAHTARRNARRLRAISRIRVTYLSQTLESDVQAIFEKTGSGHVDADRAEHRLSLIERTMEPVY
jgi:hypothetical protein